MPFNLGALGAGLGQFAQQYQQQQEAALRQQQMKLQMAQFQQKQLEQQQQREAMGRLFGLASSGGLDQQTIPGQTIGGARSGGDLGGGLRAGGALTGDPLDLIEKYESGGRNVMQGVVPPGGGYNPSVGRVTGPSSAGGYFQMIDPTWRAAASKVGIDTDQYPRAIDAPRELQRKAAQYLYDTEGFQPWAPYNPALRSALGRSGSPQVTQASYSQPAATPDAVAPPSTAATGGAPNPYQRQMDYGDALKGGFKGTFQDFAAQAGDAKASPAAPMGNMGQAGADTGDYGGGGDIMAPVRQEVQQGIQGVAKITPPSVFGKMGLSGLAQQIEKAAPGAEPAVKFMMLQEAQGLLAPDAKMQWELYKDQRKETLDKEMAVFRHTLGQQDSGTWSVMTEPESGVQYRYNPKTAQATTLTGEPYTPSGAQKLGGAGGGGSPLSAARAKDLDGETARLDKVWLEEHPLASDNEKRQAHFQNRAAAEKVLAEAKTGSGGMQAAQQMNRVTAAANLLSAELTNMSELPAMSTASIFQGIEALPGKHPGEAIKRTMAAAITPEESTDLITSFQGVARAVAALETSGAATGLVGLTESARAYQPAATDTVGNVMRKFATLRQILERGLESSAAAKGVTPEQRALYEKIKEEVARSVPFTVEEVTRLRKGDSETYKQLFDRTRKPKEATPAPGATARPAERPAAEAAIPPVPPQEAINQLRQMDSPEARSQFDAVFGEGAASRALGR